MILLNVWSKDFTKNSPDHLFQVIRWSGAVLTFCYPKKLLLMQIKFIPRWRSCTNYSFSYLFWSLVNAVLLSQWFSPCLHSCTPILHLFWVASETGDCNTSWQHFDIFREHFVHFSSFLSKSTRTLWNEYQIKTTHISTQDINFGPQKCSSAENLKNGQIII